MPHDGTVGDSAHHENKDKKGKSRKAPTLLNGTVPPQLQPNAGRRPREYLTPKEVERLIAGAKKRGRRYGLRDATMILVAFRHGLRVAELCSLTWDQIDFSQGMMHVRRVKNGMPIVQQIGGEEMRALRALKREDDAGRFVFMTERGAPMTPAGFRKLLARLGVAAKFPFPRAPAHAAARDRLQARERRTATRARCSTTSATRTSCTRCATPSSRRSGSRIFGRIDKEQRSP